MGCAESQLWVAAMPDMGSFGPRSGIGGARDCLVGTIGMSGVRRLEFIYGQSAVTAVQSMVMHTVG